MASPSIATVGEEQQQPGAAPQTVSQRRVGRRCGIIGGAAMSTTSGLASGESRRSMPFSSFRERRRADSEDRDAENDQQAIGNQSNPLDGAAEQRPRRHRRCHRRRGTTTAAGATDSGMSIAPAVSAAAAMVAGTAVASMAAARAGSLAKAGSIAPGRPPPPENRIVINVGGVRFETYKSTLKNIPDTRLAWLTETTSTNNADFDPDTGEYFFDRHSGVFAMILNYYRTGRLHTPMDICGPMFEEELAYWGIDEKQMESCCWTTYRTHRDAQETLAELNGGELSDDDDDDGENDTAKKFGIEEAAAPELTWWQRCRPRAWAWLEGQGILATVSVLFILASIVIFMVETLPSVRTVRPESNVSNCTGLTVSDCLRQTTPHAAIQVFDIVITFYFTLELLARILFCPQKGEFFKSVLNWIDIVAVFTAYVSYVVFYAMPPDSTVVALQILKVPRIFRIFKLTRHFSGLKILVHTMKASSRELMLLAIVFAIFVILCGTAVFICEQFVETHANEFTTIPIGFWWALVTMTTLGYGDVVPKSLPGYLVGGVCAISGVLVIALPVPIIVNNFALYYTHAQARLKLPKRKKRVLVGAPDALKQTVGSLSEVGDDFIPGFGGGDYSESDDTEDSSAEDAAASQDEKLRTNGSAPETPPGITVEFMDVQSSSKKSLRSSLAVPEGRNFYSSSEKMLIEDLMIIDLEP
uniref:BTB domain-containing protein n=1 Tax=Macrostomum lignano TaxID=282301 RepID=A0A1I8HWG5_9PLAT